MCCGVVWRGVAWRVQHHVIPLVYRAHFPMKLKSHSSHDIVLLCGSCHQRTCTAYDAFRQALAVEVGVSVQPKTVFSPEKKSLK
jgi:hypothetical protein